MILIITLNVIMRYVFNAPLSWGEEMDGLLLFLVLFLSMTFTWDQKRHIRMEIVYVKLKGGMRSLADLASGITGIIFFGLLAVQCFRDIPYMVKTHETGEELGFPLWPFRIIMALISLVFVIKLIIYTIYGRKEMEKEKVEIEREGIVIHKEER
jgi:TRAP-type C4-dicarboxylate transport system permease small subunit